MAINPQIMEQHNNHRQRKTSTTYILLVPRTLVCHHVSGHGLPCRATARGYDVFPVAGVRWTHRKRCSLPPPLIFLVSRPLLSPVTQLPPRLLAHQLSSHGPPPPPPHLLNPGDSATPSPNPNLASARLPATVAARLRCGRSQSHM